MPQTKLMKFRCHRRSHIPHIGFFHEDFALRISVSTVRYATASLIKLVRFKPQEDAAFGFDWLATFTCRWFGLTSSRLSLATSVSPFNHHLSGLNKLVRFLPPRKQTRHLNLTNHSHMLWVWRDLVYSRLALIASVSPFNHHFSFSAL